MRGPDKRPKPIIQIDEKGKTIRYFNKGVDAARFFGTVHSKISYNLRGKLKRADGRRFRYATEEEIIIYKELLKKEEQKKKEEDLRAKQKPVIVNEKPAEVIPAEIKKPIEDSNELSAFEKLLNRSKEKY